jgi:hypothetical protein
MAFLPEYYALAGCAAIVLAVFALMTHGNSAVRIMAGFVSVAAVLVSEYLLFADALFGSNALHLAQFGITPIPPGASYFALGTFGGLGIIICTLAFLKGWRP